MSIIYFIIGSVIGSFLCLVAERIPANRSIVRPASHCTYCQTKLKMVELIPIVSILCLGFRCRYCKCKLSYVYFFSELIFGSLCFYVLLEAVHPVYSLFFLSMAVVLSLTDLFYLIVEPRLFYTCSILLCIGHIYLALPFFPFTSLILFIALQILNYIFPDSVGGGDIFLLTVWGLFLGGESIIFLLFIASSSGLLFLFIYQYILKKTIRQLPFVPFLSIGLFFALIWK
ncbi:prepilin peptidase [Candidatus Enterococcus lemimoniae]|uniref:Leader peptidase (Prepilin peptidase)/N-methyltransferase n=1 Tax=Candidatus Enterococcus lemimoniae TaxID=1834167 RepID=A0ABZ2T7B1_9ENTE|nr:A24 family peptidase [Enterococcus sp. 12C11_DIV0727]OTO70834.1 hypothetical protein A5866_003072 [Enterococcus sp. 12C11_DIV0727]